MYYPADEYLDEQFTLLKDRENEDRPDHTFLDAQNDIEDLNRRVLVDWLISVQGWWNINLTRLYDAVNMLDRYLAKEQVSKQEFQLLGATCLWIAQKFEDQGLCQVRNYVHLTGGNTYTKEQFIDMERKVLEVLNWRLAVPTIYMFAELCLDQLSKIDRTTKYLVYYLCELTLIEARLYWRYPPSVIAASAVWLACYTRNITAIPWKRKMIQITGYGIPELWRCMTYLLESFKNTAKDDYRFKASYNNYHGHLRHRASRTKPPNSLNYNYLILPDEPQSQT